MTDIVKLVSDWYEKAIEGPDRLLPAELDLEANDFFFDEPSADPKIRQDYEAALGAFVVAYNQLDHQVVKIFRFAFYVIKRTPPRSLPGNFASRVDMLEVLSAFDVLGLNNVSFDEIRKVNSMRHILVHGHFDQNPVDGSFTLVAPKDGAEFKVKTETVREYRTRAEKAWDSLRNAEACYIFREVVVPDLASDLGR